MIKIKFKNLASFHSLYFLSFSYHINVLAFVANQILFLLSHTLKKRKLQTF